MFLPSELMTLARYMAGEFDNQTQAIADPVWFVHLRLWLRPTPLFAEDSITLFAEQASITNLDQPYRPRLLRLQVDPQGANALQVQFYMFRDVSAVQGAGRDPARLATLTPDQVEFLPGCLLKVVCESQGGDRYHFHTQPIFDRPCCFTHRGETYQVSLGFAANDDEFLSYDKGINPQTGQAIWGALMGPYQFTKRQDFGAELKIDGTSGIV